MSPHPPELREASEPFRFSSVFLVLSLALFLLFGLFDGILFQYLLKAVLRMERRPLLAPVPVQIPYRPF